MIVRTGITISTRNRVGTASPIALTRGDLGRRWLDNISLTDSESLRSG